MWRAHMIRSHTCRRRLGMGGLRWGQRRGRWGRRIRSIWSVSMVGGGRREGGGLTGAVLIESRLSQVGVPLSIPVPGPCLVVRVGWVGVLGSPRPRVLSCQVWGHPSRADVLSIWASGRGCTSRVLFPSIGRVLSVEVVWSRGSGGLCLHGRRVVPVRGVRGMRVWG